jgi:Zn finger protein HypA/HybF involved in hydrogenase expression
MKISLFTLLSILLSLTFLGCNASPSKSIDANAHQQANVTRSLPSIKRPSNDVNCRNCYATFKLSNASQKNSNGHTYTECPVCHKDYLKKL